MKVQNPRKNMVIVSQDDITALFSYGTIVAVHIKGGGYFQTTTYYSRVTNRHILEFLQGAHSTPMSQDYFDRLRIV
jgi:hypothetical protein